MPSAGAAQAARAPVAPVLMPDPEQDPTRCPAQPDGVHLFVAEDSDDVGLCGCGEIDMSPDTLLDCFEATHASHEPLPRERAERLYGRIAQSLHDDNPGRFREHFGDVDAFVRELVDDVDRPDA